MAEEEKDVDKTVVKLAMAANHYSQKCPISSRFYMSQMNAIRQDFGRGPAAEEQLTCPFCSAIFRPGNYTVILKPKMKITKKIERLRRRQFEGSVLGHFQQKLIERYEKSKNELVIECHNCGMADKVHGATRNCQPLVDLRNDRKAAKQKPSEKPLQKTKMPKLTAAMKKRKRQREARRAEKLSYDSGLPDSLTSASRTESLSLSTISSAGVDSISLSAEATNRLSDTLTPTPITSTPKLSRRGTVPDNKSTSSDSFLSLLSSIKTSPGGAGGKKKIQKKKNKKNKGGMSKLESLLSQQKHQETQKTKDTLFHFLSSV